MIGIFEAKGWDVYSLEPFSARKGPYFAKVKGGRLIMWGGVGYNRAVAWYENMGPLTLNDVYHFIAGLTYDQVGWVHEDWSHWAASKGYDYISGSKQSIIYSTGRMVMDDTRTSITVDNKPILRVHGYVNDEILEYLYNIMVAAVMEGA